jgi:nicotinate-nucleotide adenylyltransferase
MNVALFGGTFDPVHAGHLAVARAAQKRFRLERVYFVPADVPPHKAEHVITAYAHRYAMLALATQGDRSFVPSLLESPASMGGQRTQASLRHAPAQGHVLHGSSGSRRAGANYTIDTVRRFKRTMREGDRLFFLIGIDAFLEIATWRNPEALLRECEFIVVSRPGFSLADVEQALPRALRERSETSALVSRRENRKRGPRTRSDQRRTADIILPQATVHLLPGVAAGISATQVRAAAQKGRGLARFVGAQVADYIRKQGLYQSAITRQHD